MVLTAAKAGPQRDPTSEADPIEVMNIVIFQKKLLLERALKNIELLERVPNETVNMGPSKNKQPLRQVLNKIQLLERTPLKL